MFSIICSDRLFNDEITNLSSAWDAKLKILFKEKVINQYKVENPINNEDKAIYNINLILKKIHHDIYKFIKSEITNQYK